MPAYTPTVAGLDFLREVKAGAARWRIRGRLSGHRVAMIERLRDHGFVEIHNSTFTLTDKGRAALERRSQCD